MFLYRTKIKKMKICKIPLERGEDTEGHRDLLNSPSPRDWESCGGFRDFVPLWQHRWQASERGASWATEEEGRVLAYKEPHSIAVGGWGVVGAGTWGGVSGEVNAAAHSVSFTQSGIPVHGWSPTFRMCLPVSGNLTQRLPHSHVVKFLDPVTVTIKMSCHR